MDFKTKALSVFFILLLAVSVWGAYLRFFVARDFVVEGHSECDPEAESCFVSECDPEAAPEDGGCVGDPDVDVSFYKIVNRNASTVPECVPGPEGCPELTCHEGDSDCGQTLCDEETATVEGTFCSDIPDVSVFGDEEEEEIVGSEEEEIIEDDACSDGTGDCVSGEAGSEE
jgi:hypothetical protein